MRKRLLWALSILLAAALYFFVNNAGTLTLLVGMIVVPAFGLLGLAGPTPAAEIRLRNAPDKGQTADGVLLIENTGLLPIPRLKLRVVCRNLRTGGTAQTVLEISMLPRQKKRLDFHFDCLLCGVYQVSLEETERGDLIGLFFRRAGCTAICAATVLPQTFEMSISLESTDMVMPEGDTYSSTAPGDDPGETFAIREYVPGDAIHKLHWKLSEKTDKLIVREFGQLVVNEVAMFLETAGASSAEENDTIAEVFASISMALLKSGVSHSVFWRDGDGDALREFLVTDAETYTFMLSELLMLPPKEDGSVAQRFLQSYPHCAYSHVVIVGGQIPVGVRDLCNGNRVHILLPQRNVAVEGVQSDGTQVLAFDTRDYAAQLRCLEV